MLFSRKDSDGRHRAYVWRNNLLVRVDAYGRELQDVALAARLVDDGPFHVWWLDGREEGIGPDPLHVDNAADARKAVEVMCVLEERL